MTKLQLLTLSENTSSIGKNLIAEWGLSFLLKTEDSTILFDVGRNISACYNAQMLGIDLKEIDKIVLSHSHPDHTGGLRQILERINKKDKIEIIAHPDVWKKRFNCNNDNNCKYAGIPFNKDELEGLGAKLSLSKEPVNIGKNMLTTGEIPMKTDFEQVDSGNKKRLILYNGEYVDDFILDDQAIIYKSEKGLVVIAGCAHRGIINTVLHAQNITGIKDVFAVIGGSHLVDSNTERIVNTMKALEELKVKKIGLCHCTGFKALSMLYNMFPDQFITVNAGTEILF
ncbi:MAG: MBL fold metallo-hydrolase [Eubacteriaceae bacterium]